MGFKTKEPLEATIKSVERIVGPNATGETCHIVIETEGKIPFWEGQSYGIVPPGEKEMPNGKTKPHAPRLYSIASSRYGDEFDGKTTSLCVRRATYWDPEMKADDPAKKGICSNFLCDAKPGDKVMMTGPVGKALLLDESNPNNVHIMVATGTGIAPYRSFWRRMFCEDTPFKFTGLGWLFMGVANSDAKLYDDELQEILRNYPDSSAWTTRSPASSRTRTAARCTSRTRWRSTGRRSSSCCRRAPSSTSAGSRA